MLRTLVQPSHFSDVHGVYNQQQAPRSAWQRLLERFVRREAVQEVCMCMGA